MTRKTFYWILTKEEFKEAMIIGVVLATGIPLVMYAVGALTGSWNFLMWIGLCIFCFFGAIPLVYGPEEDEEGVKKK